MAELKRSQTEVTMTPNIASLETVNFVSLENVNPNPKMSRTTKQWKVYKGPNWTAYKKENLGSIPRNIEKSLVEDKKSMTKVGFSTQTERFYPSKETNKLNPGPGSYNLSGDLDFTRTSSSFYSSKGFGNGFASITDRFDSKDLFIQKYTPGPGEYSYETTSTIKYEVDKSIFNRSLYNNKKTASLKQRRNTPGPGYYNPIKETFDSLKNRNARKGTDPFFRSKVNRFKKGSKYDVNNPGPGNYFKEDYTAVYSEKYKGLGPAYYFRSPAPKVLDPNGEEILNKYDVETKQKKATLRLENKNGKILNSYNKFTPIPKLGITRKEINERNNFKKKVMSQANRKCQNNNWNDKPFMFNIPVEGYEPNEEQGKKIIDSVLGKTPKPDIYGLYSYRWKKNELEFKVPGPAYYHPRVPLKMLSFNRNTEDFIWTPGANADDYNLLNKNLD